MTTIRSLLFALLFYPGTLVYVLGVIIFSPFGDRTVQAIVHGWSDYHHFLVRYILGIRMQVDGSIPEGAYLIAFKHEAMVETVEALRIARTPVVVMKRELTTIPLFGWVTRRYGVIGVDREAGAKALRTLLA
jgi:1-acyl-sn-glycerol-3-phosphate acyltransferase